MCKKERLMWIDSMKGWGIILVIIGHTYTFANYPNLGLFLISGFMPMFFILSGVTSKTASLKKILYKKYHRLIIPYLLYGVISNVMIFIINDIPIVYLKNVFISLIYAHNIPSYENNFFLNTPLWFLPALFFSYILFYYYLNSNYKLTLFIIFFSLCILSYKSILLPFCLDIAFMGVLFIIFGYIVKTKIINMKYNMILLICSFLLYIIIIYYNGIVNMAIKNYGMRGLLSVFLFYIQGILYFFVFSILFKYFSKNTINKILAAFGKQSLRLMCIHMPVFYTVKYFLFVHIRPLFITLFVMFISYYLSLLLDYLSQNKGKYNIFSYL